MALTLPKVISGEDVYKLLAQINTKCPTGIRNYAILMTIWRAGLRVSEICKLTLPNVNLNTGLINVQQAKGRKDRYTVVDDEATEACQRWVEARERAGIDGKYYFCTLSGSKLDPRYIRDVCYRLSEKAGVYVQDGDKQKPVHPHTLRHCFATRSLNEVEMNIREVQEMLGHKNLNSTMIYTHVQPIKLAEKYRERSK